MNYYNEINPEAAEWLRELMRRGHIPAGHVDERSIIEVQPEDLDGFIQCHWFAGIGIWSLALRIAGYPSDRPIWTASLPCQPFSAAGKGQGAADERNLWPVFRSLVAIKRPQRIIGEQVSQAIGFDWLDGISTDLEKEGYTPGSIVLGAHSVRAPHRRQRLYWMADAYRSELDRSERDGDETGSGRLTNNGATHWLADSLSAGLEGHAWNGGDRDQSRRLRWEPSGPASEGGEPLRMGDTSGTSTGRNARATSREETESGSQRQQDGMRSSDEFVSPSAISGLGDTNLIEDNSAEPGQQVPAEGCGILLRNGCSGGEAGEIHASECVSVADSASPRRIGEIENPEGKTRIEARMLMSGENFRIGGGWDDSWALECRDGKFRRIPLESSLFPLADAREFFLPGMGRRRNGRAPLLKGSGNALCAETAALFIRSIIEIENDAR